MADTHPILLRPSAPLAVALTEEAEARGTSRQALMLEVLASDPGVAARLTTTNGHHDPDQLTLLGD